jgi:heptosyltransferase-2
MSELSEGAKVLVLGPNWLGDCVMAEPTVRELCEVRPDLDVTLVVPEGLTGLFRDHPVIQKIHPYKDRGEHAGFFGRRKLVAELKSEGFDAALVLRNSFGAAWDASGVGAPVRVGYAAFGRSWMLTDAVVAPEDDAERHRSISYRDLLVPMGLGEKGPGLPVIHVSVEAAKEAEELIRSEGGEPTEFLVAIHPGASYGPAKMWGEERFAALADRFVEDHDATVLMMGTKGENELASTIVGAMRAEVPEGRVRNLCGRTRDVHQMAAVFSRCTVVVGNDSGPCHVAGAVGVPTVAVFGSTSADRTGIRGEKVENLWEHVACSPCFKRECPKEDYMACMDAIPGARVYGAVRDLLGLRRQAGRRASRPGRGGGP